MFHPSQDTPARFPACCMVKSDLSVNILAQLLFKIPPCPPCSVCRDVREIAGSVSAAPFRLELRQEGAPGTCPGVDLASRSGGRGGETGAEDPAR